MLIKLTSITQLFQQTHYMQTQDSWLLKWKHSHRRQLQQPQTIAQSEQNIGQSKGFSRCKRGITWDRLYYRQYWCVLTWRHYHFPIQYAYTTDRATSLCFSCNSEKNTEDGALLPVN